MPRAYRDDLLHNLRDSAYAVAYLDRARLESDDAFRLALVDVLEAWLRRVR